MEAESSFETFVPSPKVHDVTSQKSIIVTTILYCWKKSKKINWVTHVFLLLRLDKDWTRITLANGQCYSHWFSFLLVQAYGGREEWTSRFNATFSCFTVATTLLSIHFCFMSTSKYLFAPNGWTHPKTFLEVDQFSVEDWSSFIRGNWLFRSKFQRNPKINTENAKK
jgi:hypothetical protein